MRQKFYTAWENVPLCVDVPFVSTLLGLSPVVVRRMCVSGEIRAKKAGREWRITKTELKRILGEENQQ